MFKWFKNKKKDNTGFTLVELVIVIAILAILVGLLAPQYTKYVEKSRKTADASNMDEMVKVIKVFAADPANELPTGKYVLTIGTDKTTCPEATGTAGTDGTTTGGNAGLKKELDASIPDWEKTKVKSQKWGAASATCGIVAEVTVEKDGGTSVRYRTTETNTNDGTPAYNDKFSRYMSTGTDAE